jgi:hypothetical protein
MKKFRNYLVCFLLLTAFTAISSQLHAEKDPTSPAMSNCESNKETYLVNGFHAYGDQLLNFVECYFISDMASRGYSITLSIKADKYCKFSWSKTYTDSNPDLSGESFQNVQIPITSDYKITIKIESGSVYDYFMGMDVKFVWSKSISSTDHGAKADLGFPKKVISATVKSTSDRNDLIKLYDTKDRIASSLTR